MPDVPDTPGSHGAGESGEGFAQGEVAQPIDHSSFTRTSTRADGSTIHARNEERGSEPAPRAKPPPMKRETPSGLGSKTAQIARREKAIRDRENRAQTLEATLNKGATPVSDQMWLQRFADDAVQFVKDNSQTYELTTALGQERQIIDLISAHWQAVGHRTNQLLDYKTAADALEGYFSEQYGKASQTRKARGLQGSAGTTVDAPRGNPDEVDWGDRRLLTAEERMRRAKAALTTRRPK